MPTWTQKPLCALKKPLKFEVLAKKQYFVEARWVARKLGLEKLISTQQNYDIEMVQQFFATLVLGTEEDTKMTWMTGPLKCNATFAEFGRFWDMSSKELPFPLVEGCMLKGWIMIRSYLPLFVLKRVPLLPPEDSSPSTIS
jgi:hypothetical protein